MLKRSLYIFIWLVLPICSFGNDNAPQLFEKGNALYAKGQYKEALNTYQELLNGGYQSSTVYYNMGNASYKLDDIPSAILYFEKAHKLAPNDEDINFNIRLANSKTTDKVDEIPEFFLTRWWKSFIFSSSLNTLSILSIVFFLAASGLLILYFFAGAFSIKKYSFYAAIIGFFFGLILIFMAGRQVSYFDSHKQAIVFTNSVTVKSGPVDKSSSLFVIHDGTKVNVEDYNNDWIKIKLINGNEGWIKASDVRGI
ncbi:tetratricopeptide repeat protein [Mucilaginibacter frigoritolerans]|uniref:Tetratricopeptide repeat protein n=1 Tax=Mucilaginibacter frigoritolerans TaxID=652788 RepID=A0A562TT53_9SPHI|nr:tetratricopeptide repeat protein [Mucilaginibacter frigoritolerans]TWI96256.1 tetratricopeptide repeat protein [Mucilaginibacter frigoritolerans]